MKLQYLGDARDAFKWDVLYWLCSHSDESFNGLFFIPLLTPDDSSRDGRTHPKTFSTRNHQILEFLKILREKKPRDLSRLTQLGQLMSIREFPVEIHPVGGDPHTVIDRGEERASYWQGLSLEKYRNYVIFLDPDNGIQTKTQDGTKWVLYGEMKCLLERLSDDSLVLVYQHRPRSLSWEKALPDVQQRLGKFAGHDSQADCFLAIYTGQVALVALAKNPEVGARVRKLWKEYIVAIVAKPEAEGTTTKVSKPPKLRLWPE
ncbi:MAG TPA: hypothetical protein PKG76_15830 [Acidobacteriota bacterium]|nr:hypothetical protein [Acidobacteriota bacterium]